MMFRTLTGAVALSFGLLAASTPAQAGPLGQQASQCFVLYKMAAASPANAAHKGDLQKLGALMSRTMQDEKVSQKQFDGWAGAFMQRIGAKDKINVAVLAKERDTCNTFAKARYQFYAAKK